MSTIYWSTGRSGLSVESGKYRAPDGRLVHCWRRAVDEIVCEVEGSTVPQDAFPDLAEGLVRLSDDPDWPDWSHRDTVSAFID